MAHLLAIHNSAFGSSDLFGAAQRRDSAAPPLEPLVGQIVVVVVVSAAVVVVERFRSIFRLLLVNAPGSSGHFGQDGHDSEEKFFASLMLFLCNRVADEEDVLNCGALQRRSSCDAEEACSIRITVLAVPLRNVQRNRLSGPEQVVSSMAIHPVIFATRS